jgi:hypothetical protein
MSGLLYLLRGGTTDAGSLLARFNQQVIRVAVIGGVAPRS